MLICEQVCFSQRGRSSFDFRGAYNMCYYFCCTRKIAMPHNANGTEDRFTLCMQLVGVRLHFQECHWDNSPLLCLVLAVF